MLPTEQQVKDAAPQIAVEVHNICNFNGQLKNGPVLLVDDNRGIYAAQTFCSWYCPKQIQLRATQKDYNETFEELLTAINEHTPEPYTVFWHEGALFYGDKSAFFDELTTDPDTTEPTSNHEPF